MHWTSERPAIFIREFPSWSPLFNVSSTAAKKLECSRGGWQQFLEPPAAWEGFYRLEIAKKNWHFHAFEKIIRMLVAFSNIFNFEKFSGCKVPGSWGSVFPGTCTCCCWGPYVGSKCLRLHLCSCFLILRYLRSGLERGFHLQKHFGFSHANTEGHRQRYACVLSSRYVWNFAYTVESELSLTLPYLFNGGHVCTWSIWL